MAEHERSRRSDGTADDQGSPQPSEYVVPPDEVDDDDAMRPNEAVPFERDLPGSR